MSCFRYCLLLAVICSSLSFGLGEETTLPDVIPVKPPTTTTSTTTPPPTTTTPTPPPTTTTPPPTTLTTPPTTTPTTPPTTKPTTPPTTTSTLKPTTTTVAPSPAPKPLPPPATGSWACKDATTNITCIMVEFAATLNVTYTKVKNDTSVSSYTLLNIPANATATGKCNTTEQYITISWLTTNTSTVNNTLTLTYQQNSTTHDYRLKNLNISLTADNFENPPSSDPIVVYHGAEWQTPLATSYRCKTATQMNMSSEAAGVVTARLTISNLQEEAYRSTPGTGFSAARECSGGDIPDAVPIAVGCALGGLVVVVLVAYLVGRRRSAARGYLSM